jgi:hypothetical protein
MEVNVFRGRTYGAALPAGGGVAAPAVRAAFADAGAEPGNNVEQRDALVAAGVDPHWLNGAAEITLDELSDGSVEITGVGCRRNRHVDRRRRVESDWDEGVVSAYDRKVFVSPPTGGWVFVVDQLLPLDGRSVAGLSARLGTEVQYFGTHRVPETHEWACAVDGRLVRRLFYGGCSGEFEQEGPRYPLIIDDAAVCSGGFGSAPELEERYEAYVSARLRGSDRPRRHRRRSVSGRPGR